MRKRSKTKLLAGISTLVLVCLPALSYAIGLGKLKVHSALDEPLNAEIDFTSLSKAERRKLEVSLASRAEFSAAGISRPLVLTSIKFDVAKRVDGRYFVQLRTEEPFREPFLHMLIRLEWAGGRLVREYTALIDPPYVLSGQPGPVQAPVTAPAPAPQAPTPQPVARMEPEPAVSAPQPVSQKRGQPEQVDELPPLEAEPVATEAAAMPEPAPAEPEPAQVARTEPELPPLEPAPDLLPDVGSPGSAAAETAPEPVIEQSFGPSSDYKKPKIDKSGWPEDPAVPDEPQVEPLQPLVPELGPEPSQVAAAEKPVEPLPELGPETMPMDDGLFGPSSMDASTLGGEYQVRRGDTLWEIAQKARADQSVSIEQIIMAIYQQNRHAFFKDNVNNLKAGKILKIPDAADSSALPEKRAARTEFRAQYNAWQEYKLQVASAQDPITVDESAGGFSMAPDADQGKPAAETQMAAQPEPAVIEPAEKPAAAEDLLAPRSGEKPAEAEAPMETAEAPGKPEAKTEKPADITPAESESVAAEDLLKIVRSNIEKDKQSKDKAVADSEKRDAQGEAEKLALAEKVAGLEESLESAKRQAETAGDKAGRVSETLDTQKRLIEIENQNLAKPDTDAAATTEAAKPKDQAAPVKPAEPAKPGARKRPVTPPPAPEKGFVEGLMDDLLGGSLIMQIVGGTVGVIFLIALMVYFRRRQQANIEFEESILNSQIDSEGTLSMDSGEQAESGDTSFLSDFSQGGMGNISTDEVDPIAEAEVYLAYGRDEQAEEILKEAVVRDPSRHELRVKLLEIYHQRSDTSAFETVAEELYAALEGRGGELWDKVAAMGQKLNPSNPMFGGQGAAAGVGSGDTVPPGEMDTTMVNAQAFDMPSQDTADTMMDFSGAEPSTEEAGGGDLLDFSMEEESLDIGAGEEEGGDVLDFNMTMDTSPTTEETADDGLSLGGDSGLDFDAGAGSTADEGLSMGGDEGLSFESSTDEGGLAFETDAGDSGLDFSTASEEEEDKPEISFDMGDSEETGVEESTGSGDLEWDVDAAASAEESADNSLDFESITSTDDGLSFESETTSAGGEELSYDAGSELSELVDESELAVAEGDSTEQWDETATKLDLARAYIDMGDAEGARSILEEVVAEGSDEQKKQASDLMSQIS